MFEYLPGQFSFITPLSPGLAREEHPFTIASTPTRPEALEFIIRTASDWTEQVDRLQPGDNVLLDGPFGRFSHLMQPAAGEMIMIAGGIGITPMLSMLRYMADHDDQRKITLIWSNRTEAHMVLKQEFSRLESKLRGLVIHKVFTRESDAGDRGGRLDRAKLKKLLTDCTRISDVFVCGPDRMIKDVVAHVAALGFPKRLIRSERFSL
jgi:ferredoxin-NADP reductase